ncbi:hypothetical protein QE428_002623 [Microbacterium sp. SORGH_AS 505]|uniref:hypothetical protein n=1 Tax=Microbacterium sp. SORGH_AS_0505 TaxID=3041770 RepID=UPI00278660A6|nr:hypothetical protein [Microbacterium sp. SORGH_AS_0505]MDQ1127590.1 hypothetical protein [Microbacterium sp. SORGH_AS_0505]
MATPTTPPSGGSGASRPRRTQVEAIDDLTAELRTANHLKALELGAKAWKHDEGRNVTSPSAIADMNARNGLRAQVRAALNIEEQ